eukprot:TRINITY_DN13126_c0_g1_i1.p1 TRINITY_DN13126_c0_g1~~TRINITY_DN13126_c0_g1_i1.p1  ORF type:complete len:307 (+),score=43.82 TRINITY_DN13126_c0_g1_i1:44-964(+)
MDSRDFLPEYRNISNKLKKRFLRRPNVADASENFRQLGKRLEDSDEPQYAGFCYLATGRCEKTVGNSCAEIEATTQAARCFLRAESVHQKLKTPSFEENLSAAIAGYKQAAKLEEEMGRPNAASALFIELGDELFDLDRPAEALFYYDQALKRESGSICDTIFILRKICDCHLALGDHHNALKEFTKLGDFCVENDPCQHYHQLLASIEIFRVLLLLIIQPSKQSTSPNLIQVLDKYKWEDLDDCKEQETCPFLDSITFMLLQSIVQAVQVNDADSLLYLEDEISPSLNKQQKSLLAIVVTREVKK